MKWLAKRVLSHRKPVIGIFLVLSVICVFLQFGVSVNYNLVDYLPDEASSTTAIDLMNQEFQAAAPNLRVCVPNVTIAEALAYKEALQKTEGVEMVLWLDDMIDLKQPLEMADPDVVASYYRDSAALFMVAGNSDLGAVTVLEQVRAAVGKEARIAGDLADSAATQMSVQHEIGKIMLVLVPLILVILLLTTHSWFEPVLFAVTIGISILINLGTNLLLGQISFLTQGVAPILQLAVSMDYAIFLLSSFERFREQGEPVELAMEHAMCRTASTVFSSGATTVIGFLVLALMRFKIGPDMGIVLAKGILISMVTSLIFLPVLALSCCKLLERTRHKSLLPSFRRVGKATVAARIPAMILVLLLLVPCFLAQKENQFTYGNAGASNGSQIGEDTDWINQKFGKSLQMVLLVPRGEWGNERTLEERLKNLEGVTSVVSYASSVGTQIPTDFLSEQESSQLLSAHYSRIILDTGVSEEGPESFALVEQVRSAAGSLYGDRYALCGLNVSNYDMRETITADSIIVNGAAIAAIGFVLLLTFRSLSLPLILLLAIEAAIWVNMAIPFFLDQSLPYIAYLIVSTVQLGATIDYAILLSEHYLEKRKQYPKKEAAVQTVATSAPSILVPAAILTCAGFSLGLLSSNGIVGQVGLVLARGTICSAVSVLFFLPALLLLFDRVIEKTTYRLRFPSEKNGDGYAGKEEAV